MRSQRVSFPNMPSAMNFKNLLSPKNLAASSLGDNFSLVHYELTTDKGFHSSALDLTSIERGKFGF
jgi:hypothetical protein